MTKGEAVSDRHRKRLERERTTELMWMDGYTTEAIAKLLDTTKGTVDTLIKEMRASGRDVPRRR